MCNHALHIGVAHFPGYNCQGMDPAEGCQWQCPQDHIAYGTLFLKCHSLGRKSLIPFENIV